MREATFARKPSMTGDPFRFFTGGGDLEHAWCFTGDVHGADPDYPVAVELTKRVMTDPGEEKRGRRDAAGRALLPHGV